MTKTLKFQFYDVTEFTPAKNRWVIALLSDSNENPYLRSAFYDGSFWEDSSSKACGIERDGCIVTHWRYDRI